MRRLTPWLLLGALLAVTGAGAGLGVAMQPSVAPSAAPIWGQTLAATQAAGSARFKFSVLVQSANPDLRSRTTGFGVVDFASGRISVVTIQRSVTYSSAGGGPLQPEIQTRTTREVDVAGFTYYRENLPGSSGDILARWIRIRIPKRFRTTAATAVLERIGFGEFPIPDHMSERSLGTAHLDGSRATGYAFSPTPSCRVRGPAAGQHLTLGTFEVWVDGAGRLVGARTVVSETTPPGSLPAPFPEQLAGTSRTTSTLRLSDFGGPVQIVVPTVGPPVRAISSTLAAVSSSTC